MICNPVCVDVGVFVMYHNVPEGSHLVEVVRVPLLMFYDFDVGYFVGDGLYYYVGVAAV